MLTPSSGEIIYNTMDRSVMKTSGKDFKGGIKTKKSVKKGGGKKIVKHRKKHGPMHAQPEWKPFMM